MIPSWTGLTVAVLAGGPSLSTAQVRLVAIARLEDRCRVIAVNDTVFLAWWADWLHSSDLKWWQWHIQRVQHFKGVKTTVDPCVPSAWVTKKLSKTGKTGFDPSPENCRGNNSGYQAIHCAVHAGAKRILLLGFDMRGTHWFGSHPDAVEDGRAETMAPHFATLTAPLKELGVEVFNCSGPGSLLDCFPKRELCEAL